MNDLGPLRQHLARRPEIRLAIVFGSVARGRAQPRSDIDIAALADTELGADAKLDVIGKIAEVTGRAVDLVDLRRTGEPLLGQVLKGIRILGNDADYAELALRRTYANEDFLPYARRVLEERRKAWIGQSSNASSTRCDEAWATHRTMIGTRAAP